MVKHPINRGIPGLVAVPTGKTVIVNGKHYGILKLKYDLKGEVIPLAMPLPI